MNSMCKKNWYLLPTGKESECKISHWTHCYHNKSVFQSRPPHLCIFLSFNILLYVFHKICYLLLTFIPSSLAYLCYTVDEKKTNYFYIVKVQMSLIQVGKFWNHFANVHMSIFWKGSMEKNYCWGLNFRQPKSEVTNACQSMVLENLVRWKWMISLAMMLWVVCPQSLIGFDLVSQVCLRSAYC